MDFRIKLDVYDATDYFAEVGKTIDYDDLELENTVPYKQACYIDEILTTEESLYMLRRLCGMRNDRGVDCMYDIRTRLIREYEERYKEDYVTYNDFM